MTPATSQAKASGWVGFGIAEAGGMPGADIVYYERDADKIFDAHALQYASPSVDDCQDWTLLSSAFSDGWIHVEAERLLDTEDLQDWAIIDDRGFGVGTKFIAAWGNSPTIAYHASERTKGALHFFGETEPVDPLLAIKNKAGIQSKDLTAKDFAIPTDRTTYADFCQDLPSILGVDAETGHHILAIEPLVHADTERHVHHFVLHAFTSSST